MHSNLEEKTIKINDISVSYTDSGQGVTPIIFIHGFPFNKSTWENQIEFLKSSNRVIAYDIRGFGKTTSGFEDQSIDLFADDLIQFMDTLKIDKAIVCGLSMGGYIVLNAVSRYSNRFSAIILSDTQCISDTPVVKEHRDLTILQILAGGIADYAEGFVKKVFCKNTFDHKIEIVNYIKDIILDTPILSLTETLSALANRNEICSKLKNIQMPSLVICGEEDLLTTPAQSQYLSSQIFNSELILIPKAGHLTNLEQPGEFNRVISNFVYSLNQKELVDEEIA